MQPESLGQIWAEFGPNLVGLQRSSGRLGGAERSSPWAAFQNWPAEIPPALARLIQVTTVLKGWSAASAQVRPSRGSSVVERIVVSAPRPRIDNFGAWGTRFIFSRIGFGEPPDDFRGRAAEQICAGAGEGDPGGREAAAATLSGAAMAPMGQGPRPRVAPLRRRPSMCRVVMTAALEGVDDGRENQVTRTAPKLPKRCKRVVWPKSGQLRPDCCRFGPIVWSNLDKPWPILTELGRFGLDFGQQWPNNG